MKKKAIVGKLKGDRGYNAIVYNRQSSVDKLRGCEFAHMFLFGDFTSYEMETILPCVNGNERKIIKVM